MNGEFEELVQRYLEGTASAEEVRLVDEQIQRDPSAQRPCFRWLRWRWTFADCW